MDLLERITGLEEALGDLEGHETAKASIGAQLQLMRPNVDADLETRRRLTRALAAALLKERTLSQTRLGQELMALAAEYAT
jgi:hypothetical protein